MAHLGIAVRERTDVSRTSPMVLLLQHQLHASLVPRGSLQAENTRQEARKLPFQQQTKPVSCGFAAENEPIPSANRAAEYFICCELHGVNQALATCGLSQRLRFRVHQLLHHQVYVDDGTEVEGPVEEAVAHELRDKRPQEGECKSLR